MQERQEGEERKGGEREKRERERERERERDRGEGETAYACIQP